jgi:hypothetical protein
MNEKVRHLDTAAVPAAAAEALQLDLERARRVLPVLRQISGVEA